jgi:hypothetical protein
MFLCYIVCITCSLRVGTCRIQVLTTLKTFLISTLHTIYHISQKSSLFVNNHEFILLERNPIPNKASANYAQNSVFYSDVLLGAMHELFK